MMIYKRYDDDDNDNDDDDDNGNDKEVSEPNSQNKRSRGLEFQRL